MFKAKYNCILWVCVFFITSKGNIRAGFSVSECVLPFSCAVLPGVVGFLYSYKQVKYFKEGGFYLPSQEKLFCIFSASMTSLSLYAFLNRKSHNIAMLSLCMVGGISSGIFFLRGVKRKIKDKIIEIIAYDNFLGKNQVIDQPNAIIMKFLSEHLIAVVNCYKNDTDFLSRIDEKLTKIMQDFKSNTDFSIKDYMRHYGKVLENIAILINNNRIYNLFKDVSVCKMDLLNVLNKIIDSNEPDENEFWYYFNIIKQMHNEANSANYVEECKNFIHEMIRLLLKYRYFNHDKCEKVQKLFDLFQDPSNKDIFDRKRFKAQVKDAIANVFGYNNEYSYDNYIKYYDMVKHLVGNELDGEDNEKFIAECKEDIIYKSFNRFMCENNYSNDNLVLGEKADLIVKAPFLTDQEKSEKLLQLCEMQTVTKDQMSKINLDYSFFMQLNKDIKDEFNRVYKEKEI